MKDNALLKVMAFLVVAALSVSTLSSCGKRTVKHKDVFNCCGSTNIAVLGGLTAINQNGCVIINSEDESEHDFICDPFYNEETDGRIEGVFSDGEMLYALVCYDNAFEIISHSPKTHKVTSVYKKTVYRQEREILFGAAKIGGASAESFFSSSFPRFFAIFENKLFIATTEALSVIDLKTKSVKVVSETFVTSSNLSYKNGVVYFIDSYYDIYAYTISTEVLKKAENVKAVTLLATPEAVYYCTVSGKLYKCNDDLSSSEYLTDINAMAMDYYEDSIFFINPQTQKVYRLDKNRNITEFLDIKGCTGICVMNECGRVAVTYLTPNGEKCVTSRAVKS